MYRATAAIAATAEALPCSDAIGHMLMSLCRRLFDDPALTHWGYGELICKANLVMHIGAKSAEIMLKEIKRDQTSIQKSIQRSKTCRNSFV